jgi:formate C-acetyltransferase
MMTGATPDGRLAGVSLCNSSGAAQGMDVNGPTAMINSVTRFPMVRSSNGQVLDIKFTPSVIAGETGGKALRALIETYFRKGGMEIQVSAVSRETLLDAQARPELHGDLVVRVSGFSAYFTSLNLTTQNEIIERTENAY